VTGPAARPERAQASGPTPIDRTFLYQFFRQSEASDTWTADAACPADSPDSPVPYTLTAKAETLLGETGYPTTPLPNAHSCAICTQPPPARPGVPGEPPAYVTEISVPPSDSGIHRLHARMNEPEPEPEAGL
jgi:hypothetical protein